MFKNLIMIYGLVILTICLKTVNAINCYSCGSVIYPCSSKNDERKVRCNADLFSSCANMVKFYNNGTTIVKSSFCYTKLKDDNEDRECKDDGYNGQICKIICKSDYCNSIDRLFISPFEHQIINIKPLQNILPPKQNIEIKNSFLLIKSNYLLITISLLVCYLFSKVYM